MVEREKRPDPWQYNIPSLFEAPQASWSPRCPIHGSPRKAAIVSGVDIFHISKLPGPGQYFVRTDPRSFTGRDRSLRPRLPMERLNAGAFSSCLPICTKTAR